MTSQMSARIELQLGQTVEDWIVGRTARQEIAPSTAESYRQHLRHFVAHIGAEQSLADIDQRDIEGWLAAVAQPPGRPPLAPSTMNTRAATVRSFFRYCLEHRLIERDPMLHIRRAKTARRPVRDVPPDQVAAVLRQADFRSRTMIILATQMLLRRAEIADLRVEDWDRGGQFLYIRGKGSRDRNLPLTEEAAEALEAWLSDGRTSGPMWPSSHRRGEALAKRTVSEVIGRAARDAGLHITPHQYRHTGATQMIDHGATLPAVRDTLGHSSLANTDRYTHTRPEALREQMEGRTYFDRKAS